ncbi:MAG: glutamyl-tRNA reductase [Actinomycetia bacterium]|nr:glutamyl-tRNA reductase [Actinomycetes bacterium]
MTVVAIGLSHRTAPAAMLEALSLSADAVPKALAEVSRSDVVTEAVVLSTCNRTEFYVHAERFHDGFRDIRHAIGLLSGVDPERFDPYVRTHYHQDAVRHLFEVTAGLDSVVLGEHEILGQVGRAWEAARTEQTSGPVLNLLFQRAIEGGKKVRTDTDIGRNTASLSHAAVSLLAERRNRVAGSSVLLVGTGEVGAGVATALTRKHDVELKVANRTAARAETIAAELEATAIAYQDMAHGLGEIDIIITATGASEPIFSIDELTRATRSGQHPLFVLDLALPRDLPLGAASIDGVDVCDLSDVQEFANRGLEARREHLGAARTVVDAEIERYQAASSAREVAPLIGELHGWANGVRTTELDRYSSRLAQLAPADREAVEALSRSLVAKLLHQPTVALKDAAGTARGDRLAETVRELFNPW